MCFRNLSTFSRCGHQDSIAHVKICSKALQTSPSTLCPLGEGQISEPIYDIPTFCPQCTLNRTFVAPNGHLQESSSGASIVFEVPNPKQAKLVEDVGQSKQTTDSVLAWKEPSAVMGGFDGGWDEPAAGAGGDWGTAPTETGGDWNAAPNETGGDLNAKPVAATSTNGSGGVSPMDSATGGMSEVGGAESWADASDKEAKKQDEAGGHSLGMEEAKKQEEAGYHGLGTEEAPMMW